MLWLPLLILLIAGCAAKSSPQTRFKLGEVIPIGKTTVEVVTVRYNKRTEELALKMSAAITTNQVWWLAYIQKHAGDYPLPYHANLGLTQKEYAEFADGADKTGHLQKVSDAYLIFERQGNLISIDLGDKSSPVEKWRLNILTGELFLSDGEAIKPVWQSGNDETRPIGVYEGYHWDYENAAESASNCKIASLEIFRLKPSGMIFWRIKEGEIQNGHSIRSLDLAFRYDHNHSK